jgi:hypothetical protein
VYVDIASESRSTHENKCPYNEAPPSPPSSPSLAAALPPTPTALLALERAPAAAADDADLRLAVHEIVADAERESAALSDAVDRNLLREFATAIAENETLQKIGKATAEWKSALGEKMAPIGDKAVDM